MIPAGWKIERLDCLLKTIHVIAPNGYVAVVTSISRNPENVLYMLADTLLKSTAPTHQGEKPWPFTGCAGPLTDCDMEDKQEPQP